MENVDPPETSVDAAVEARLLCSFAPILMLNAMEQSGAAITPPTTHQYEGIALFADISGFSALNEHFAQDGGEGLGSMMSLVNMYFQQMIKITSACGGDVIKFAGDALIVLWTDGPKHVLAHRACECAMELQDVLHDEPMTPEIRLSLKVGVGMGDITMYYVGGHGGRCEYFAAGPALRECFDASEMASKGDVIISSTVLDQVQDVSHAKQLNDSFYSLRSMEKTFRKRSVNRMCRSGAALTPDALNALRSYAPPILLSANTLEASLKHLSVRGWTVSVVQTSVIFVNFGIGGLMDTVTLDCDKIHTAVVTVQRIVQTLQGCIHRFTVDDKGCVMKVVFGAQNPHEDQPYRALLAALQLRQALSLQGIQAAVGVASGESLMGPVGSAVRQEFTVHGDKIILAARLMQLATSYGGMVLCDEETFLATRDDVRFIHLRPVMLKGRGTMVQPYRPVASSELLDQPILSAKPSAAYWQSESIRQALEECSSWLTSEEPEFQAIVAIGQHGSGKTQLLMQARARFETSSRVLHVRCREHEAAQRGSLLRRLFAQLCGHDVWPSLEHIMPMIAASAESADAALIEHELQMLHSHAAADKTGCRPASFPLGGQRAGRLVLIIDDIHHADTHSCELLLRLVDSAPSKLFLFLACRESRLSLVAPSGSTAVEDSLQAPGQRLVHSMCTKRKELMPKARSLHLRALGASACRELACAELDVASIPATVTQLLTRRSGGSPLLCQAIARSLVSCGALRVDSKNRGSELTPSTSDSVLNVATTEALVRMRHSVLSVKFTKLDILQQVILKTMALLPQPCVHNMLLQAMPLQVDATTLMAQLRSLRECHLIAVPQSHRQSLPGVLSKASNDSVYCFVDIGMREVCQCMMIESQRRQIKLRMAAASESKLVLGSLTESISSSSGADDLARSLSPNMLRMSKLRGKSKAVPKVETSGCRDKDSDGTISRDGSDATADRQWWLSRSWTSRSPPPQRLARGAVARSSPLRWQHCMHPVRRLGKLPVTRAALSIGTQSALLLSSSAPKSSRTTNSTNSSSSPLRIHKGWHSGDDSGGSMARPVKRTKPVKHLRLLTYLGMGQAFYAIKAWLLDGRPSPEHNGCAEARCTTKRHIPSRVAAVLGMVFNRMPTNCTAKVYPDVAQVAG